MLCSKAREFLSLKLDGVLPPDATVKLEGHLEECADCREYRSDLTLGQRLLAATEPELPDNFDWKLQLRLSRTLRETAGEAAFPWGEKQRDVWGRIRNFGAAAAVGMAAVLTFALFVGPIGGPDFGSRAADPQRSDSSLTAQASDRLPLERSLGLTGLRRSGGLQQQVAGMSTIGSPRAGLDIDRGWSGGDLEDLRTINRLRAENRFLQTALWQAQRQLNQIQSRRDTTSQEALDPQE